MIRIWQAGSGTRRLLTGLHPHEQRGCGSVPLWVGWLSFLNARKLYVSLRDPYQGWSNDHSCRKLRFFWRLNLVLDWIQVKVVENLRFVKYLAFIALPASRKRKSEWNVFIKRIRDFPSTKQAFFTFSCCHSSSSEWLKTQIRLLLLFRLDAYLTRGETWHCQPGWFKLSGAATTWRQRCVLCGQSLNDVRVQCWFVQGCCIFE